MNRTISMNISMMLTYHGFTDFHSPEFRFIVFETVDIVFLSNLLW